MFSIGDLSRRTGVKVPTIRYYEQMGLVAAPERSEGNQRRYSRQELDAGLHPPRPRSRLRRRGHPRADRSQRPPEQPCGHADRSLRSN